MVALMYWRANTVSRSTAHLDGVNEYFRHSDISEANLFLFVRTRHSFHRFAFAFEKFETRVRL